MLIEVGMAVRGTAIEMAPYLLFGFFVAGLLSVVVSPELVEKHLGGHGMWPIVKASLFGIPLPLCSCGVIPVAASLRRHGASAGATASFLLSTPQTGVDSVMVSLSLLGPVFAIFRPLFAFVTGIVGGTIVQSADDSAGNSTEIEPCVDSCCQVGHSESRLRRALRHGFVTLPGDIAKPLLIGLVVAGAVSAVIHPSFLPEVLGTGMLAMIVMMALGIPVYVCATASVPVAAALMMKGITPGAALVFLMTGPATNAATVATIWKMLGRRAAVTYLAVVAFTALGAGMLLDYVFKVGDFTSGGFSVLMLPEWVRVASAAVLVVLLGMAVMPEKHDAHSCEHDGEDTEDCCET